MEGLIKNKEQQKIINKLDTFIETGKVPHLLFYGTNGTGKRTLLNYLIKKLYNDINNKSEYIIQINCCQFKGIKYIREDLKFFGKKQIHNHNDKIFKSIVLYNADFLTIDAQSSLRRLIEIYSKNTRFFMITSNQNKIIRPILSRFCLIYVPEMLEKNNCMNLHSYKNSIIDLQYYKNQEKKMIKSKIDNLDNLNHKEILFLSKEFYNKTINIDDLLETLKKTYLKDKNITKLKKINNFEFKIKYLMKEMKNDTFIIYTILLFFRFNYDFSI
tara:strand:+ start:2070 stop:2885 length:816 start_codon:yes stop_codon:yes gene_type:complete